MSALTINGTALPTGQRTMVRVPVFTDLDGVEIGIHIHAVVGARPGPVLAVATAHHGRHWMSAEITRNLVEGLDPSELSGTLLALPVSNPLTMASRTRHTRDESDSPDLNRVFGIPGTFIVNQLAEAIVEHMLRKANAQIILSAGPFWTVRSTSCARDYSNPSVSEQSFILARAFGLPYIRRGDSLRRNPGMAMNFAGNVLGIPSFLAELGGVGFGQEREAEWIQENVRGVRQVMQQMGILPGTPVIPERALTFEKHERINPHNGGMLEPLIPVDDLMVRELQQGDLLGRVWSPYTFEILEELRAPVRGLVDMTTPAYPVRPGDWSSLMVDLDHPDTRWIHRDELP